MATSLCETFRSLSFKTFDQIGRARRVNHQPFEETFTDTNILELMDRHPNEVVSRLFNKREEGANGADWEWWLTNNRQDCWLGLRVQAKILHLKSDTFAHLHYKSGKSRVYQLAKLKRACKNEGLVPLYCFYLHQASNRHPIPETYGCSLASLTHVEALQQSGERNDFRSVMRKAVPWHWLVCDRTAAGVDLPQRAWAMVREYLDVPSPRPTRSNVVRKLKDQLIGPRPQPPKYVLDLVQGREVDSSPSGVRGILILRESE